MSRRAVSLAEVLVGSGLAFLVLSVGVMVLIPALRVWNRGQARSEVQQAVMVAESWLRRDVEHAAPESLYWQDGGLRMIVQGRPLDYDASGASLWHEQVLYWVNPQGDLHRQSRELTPPPSEPPVLSAPTKDPLSRIIARRVYAFDCAVNEDRVRVHLEADYQGHHYTLDGMCSTILKGLQD